MRNSCSNFLLRVCAITILFSLLITPEAYAAEQWSTDLWNGSTPTQNESNTNSQKEKKSSGGLWSDQLWIDTPLTRPEESPVEELLPVEKPQPVEGIDEISSILVMQVANNKAMVRGIETKLAVPPTLINDHLMIPLKFTSEILNATFSWSNNEKKATMELLGNKIEVWAGKSIAVVNSKKIQLDAPPVVLDRSLLIPVRFVSENFGCRLEYEPISRTVTISELKAVNPTPADSIPESKPIPVPEEEAKPSQSRSR